MTTKQDKERAKQLLDAAFTATIEVLTNRDAPPTAKSSAIASAVKLREALVGDGASSKEPSEMSYDELQASIEDLRRLASGGSDDAGEIGDISSDDDGAGAEVPKSIFE